MILGLEATSLGPQQLLQLQPGQLLNGTLQLTPKL